MTAPLAALQQYDEQAALASTTVDQALALWRQLDPSAISASWLVDDVGARLFVALSTAQELAATRADPYTTRVLAEQGITISADGEVIPLSLAGISSDGRPLEDLLLQPVITTVSAQAHGMPLDQAMTMGANALTRIVGTQVQDASRAAAGISVATRQRVGWVRMLTPPSCGRCAILAGRFYRWSDGFARHPLCNCVNVPSMEDTADDIRTDPKAYFNSLSEAEQNKQFTKAGAAAIRDGADISRVVNARRGALGLSAPGRLTADEQKAMRHGNKDFGHLKRTDVYGRPLSTTTEATTARSDVGRRLNGKVPRLMPESIYEIATDRDDAVRLLRRFGYIN